MMTASRGGGDGTGLARLAREYCTTFAGLRTHGVPVAGDLLCDAAAYAAASNGVRRVVLACDPGVQTGWVLAALCEDGVIVPIASWVAGLRATVGVRASGGRPAQPPTSLLQSAVIEVARGLCDDWIEAPSTVVCEDWFAGPNPGTSRDIARQYYFVEAATERAGLTFRSVAHSTWKKTYLGRGNMKSADALVAYVGKGFAAHPHVTRWGEVTASSPGVSDDAAALGIAAWWLTTEQV